MRKILGIALALMLCVSCACAEEEHFEFAVLREVYDGEDNQVISPVSLAYALAMAAQGAEGETKQEILNLLDVEELARLTGLQQMLAEAGLRQANAAFLAGEMTPKEDYVTALRSMYGAEWFEGGDLVEKINAWVQEHTDGMIEKLVEELPDDTMLTLVNAVAMDAKWMSAFDPGSTYDDVFHAPGGDVTVPFMHKTFFAGYGERDGVQLLRLGYRGDDYEPTGLTLLIALPEAGGVESVLEQLCAEGLDYFAFDENETRIELSMPKVDVAAESDLKDALKALGMETAFGEQADFSGITEEMELSIGSVRQKARLIMDEEGTRAAAATEVGMVAMSLMPEEIVEFNMNRPFVLAVAHEASGAVCFAGVVTNPSAN